MIPQSIAGIVGLIITVVFILGMSAPDLYPDESQKIIDSQNSFTASLNKTLNSSTNTTSTSSSFWDSPIQSTLGYVGLDGYYSFFIDFFSMGVDFVVMVIQYLFFFIGISTTLPREFYLFFALICSGLIISIVKLVFMSGD